VLLPLAKHHQNVGVGRLARRGQAGRHHGGVVRPHANEHRGGNAGESAPRRDDGSEQIGFANGKDLVNESRLFNGPGRAEHGAKPRIRPNDAETIIHHSESEGDHLEDCRVSRVALAVFVRLVGCEAR
jgi:hypothetical protein